MGDVIKFNGPTKGPIPVSTVLQGAVDKQETLEDVIIIARTHDGEWYWASSSGYKPDLLYYTECFKQDLVNG